MQMEQVCGGNHALEDYGRDGLGWWIKYNCDDINVDYQFNNQITSKLEFVGGFRLWA